MSAEGYPPRTRTAISSRARQLETMLLQINVQGIQFYIYKRKKVQRSISSSP